MGEISIRDLESFKSGLKIFDMKIYSNSLCEFVILDYSLSHSQLLIRSKKNKNREYNIDIIFKGVLLLFLPSNIMGVEISLIRLSDIQEYLSKNYSFKDNKDYKVFSLMNSEGKGYFVNAMCFGVYHNKLDILETSIGRYDMENHSENILWFAE